MYHIAIDDKMTQYKFREEYAARMVYDAIVEMILEGKYEKHGRYHESVELFHMDHYTQKITELLKWRKIV